MLRVDELCFDQLKSGFSYGIIIGTGSSAERTIDVETGEKIVQPAVIELPSPIGMEQLNLCQGKPNRGKGLFDQLSIFSPTHTVTDDFSIMKVKKDAKIMPGSADTNIGQVADQNPMERLSGELPIQAMGNPSFFVMRQIRRLDTILPWSSRAA